MSEVTTTNRFPNIFSKDNQRPTSGAAVTASLFASLSQWSIYFPAMPEQIELARSYKYKVQQTPASPDGLAYPMYAEQLKIPLSFKLHAFDDQYCQDGPGTLLDIAAKLHSLVLPNFKSIATSISVQNATENAGGKGNNSDQAIASAQPTTTVNQQGDFVGGQDVLNHPEPVILVLIRTSQDGPGIQFNGYIENVKVTLIGPWLSATSSSRGPYMNLPSAAQFDFTMVHNPGRGTGKSIQMPSSWIQRQFYNTLVENQKNSEGYTGQVTSLSK